MCFRVGVEPLKTKVWHTLRNRSLGEEGVRGVRGGKKGSEEMRKEEGTRAQRQWKRGKAEAAAAPPSSQLSQMEDTVFGTAKNSAFTSAYRQYESKGLRHAVNPAHCLLSSSTHLHMRLKKPSRCALCINSPRSSRMARMNWNSQIDASAGEQWANYATQ